MPVPVTQEALRAREQAFYDDVVARNRPVEEYLDTVNADRRARWEAWLSQMEVPDALTAWAAAMTMLSKSVTVRVHRNDLPWIIALLVVRYGEAEYHWPHEFSDLDIARATKWYTGEDVPRDLDRIKGVEGRSS